MPMDARKFRILQAIIDDTKAQIKAEKAAKSN